MLLGIFGTAVPMTCIVSSLQYQSAGITAVLLTVTIRAYLHGLGLLQHRTRVMAPSVPARLGAILVLLMILPLAGVHGPTRGVIALFCGFVVETLTVWWGIRGRRCRFWGMQPGQKTETSV